MSISVTTRSFSNQRDGVNLSESVLTSVAVQQKGIVHLFDLVLADDARGTEGMPLIVAGLTMSDGLAHDVLYTATMANDVYAFDANTGELLWKQHVGNPIIVTKAMDMYQINDNWGILSTPVINPATNTIYVVSFSSPDGLIKDNLYQLHTLSLIDGSDQAPPVNLNKATYQPPGLHLFTLGSVPRKQRPGLLFDSRNGIDTVYIAFGSFVESASTNQGWVIACDVTGFKSKVAAAWTSAGRYDGGGIWMGGQGLSMDNDGFLYGMTGNGAFDPPTDFGECFFKLQYTPASGTVAAKITCVDWFSPYTDTGRVGADPTLPDLSLVKNVDFGNDAERVAWERIVTKVEGTTNASSNMNSASDEDLGSGGPLLILTSNSGFAKNVIFGGGKDGLAYVLDMDDMGQTALADFAPDKIAGNYEKLLSPPYGLTYYPAGVNIKPTDLSTIPTQYGGYTHHIHGCPVCYQSPDHGFMLFVGGENGPVRAFRLNPDYSITYLATGQEVASASVRPPGGMPGSMMTLSADGPDTNTAVLWVTQPIGDANKQITGGRLLAYGANWIDETTGNLIKLWDSFDWGINFTYSKFNIPMCANGKLYVPTYDGKIMVFGLG